MEAVSSGRINPERLKSFVRNVCIVAKKHKEREEARAELEEQLRRLKRFSSKKKEMDEELKELNRKISLVLEKEVRLLGIERGEGAVSRELMRNVAANGYKMGLINNSIKDIKAKLDKYIQMKTERERRVKELEKRIKSKITESDDVSLLRNRLMDLVALYNRLRKQGVDVSRVESRIGDLRLRLMV